MTDQPPLLAIDVDGVLNPYSIDATQATNAGYKLQMIPAQGVTYPVWLNPAHGPLLLRAQEAGMELVWATTWQDLANVEIGPRIGLPELPVIDLGLTRKRWKWDAVAEFAAGRPLAWLDDDFQAVGGQSEFLRARGTLPTKLTNVYPITGLTGLHVTDIIRWHMLVVS